MTEVVDVYAGWRGESRRAGAGRGVGGGGLPLADALIAGGLPVAEITFRTAAAAEVIRTLAVQRPELLVGAGTVAHPDGRGPRRNVERHLP